MSHESRSPESAQPRDLRSAARAFSADVRDWFRTRLHGPMHDELEVAHREVMLSRAVVLIWMSTIVMPTAIWSYVAVYAPAQLPFVVAVVGGAIAAVLVHRALILRGFFEKYYQGAMLVLVGGIFAPTGATVLEVTVDSQVNFFFSFFLIYFAFTALFPADVAWVLATSGVIATSFMAVHFAYAGVAFDAAFVSNLIYLGELTFIGLVLNRVVYTMFFDEQIARLKLRRANDGLRELDRAKSEFFANISHELRTPLTLILTPLTHLVKSGDAALSPNLAQTLDGVRGNANRLLRMVNMLLDFAKVEAGRSTVEYSRFILDDLVAHVAALFRGTAERKGITLRFESGFEHLPVVADADKVEQMLVNLVGNALKFTPESGEILLSTAKHRDDQVLIAVKDTGLGIAPENQELVFRRFAQVRGDHRVSVRGTGIGLSMVREFARMMGGDVSLQSALGQGSTFTIRLPVEPESTLAADEVEDRTATVGQLDPDLVTAEVVREVSAGPTVIPHGNPDSPWVLVVDDNPSLVKLVSSILSQDYNIRTASSGHAALTSLRAHPAQLVVSDVMMPGMTGLELCAHIRESDDFGYLPVVLLTARGGAASAVEGLASGADDYIGKPFDPAELRARVRAQFDKREMIDRLEQTGQDLRDAMDHLKAEEVKLVASEKLRTLGDLSAGIFHELHNYLNMIFNGAIPLQESAAELVESVPEEEQDPILVEEIEELVQLIIDASSAARSITSELKIFAHKDSGEKSVEYVNLHDLIRSNVRMFGRLDADLSVEFEFAEEEITVPGVSSRLILVFTNLVKNAFEAMAHKGTVTIGTEIDATEAVIRVRDTGTGVPEAFRDKLFEPFQSTKPPGSGLGLGLSLVSKVIHEMAGTITYDEAYTDGAQFIIRIPASEITEGAPAVPDVAKV